MKNDWRRVWTWFVALTCALLLSTGARAAGGPSYTDIVSANSGLCLSTAGNSSTAGAAVVQTSCSGGANTTWALVSVAGNRYQLVLQGTGQCLAVYGDGSTTAGTKLVQWPCSGTAANGQWTFLAVGSSYRLVSAVSGMCAAVAGASNADGAQVVQWPCQSATSLGDQFNLYLPVQAATNVVAAHSGRCMVESGNTAVQGACNSQGSTSWSFVAAGSGFQIVSNSGKCLAVNGNSLTAGATVIPWACGDTRLNGQWTVLPVNGRYRLVSALSGMCAAVNGGSNADGALIVQWPCQSATALNDQFLLTLPQTFPAMLPSAWSPVIPLPVPPVGLANTPTGKLVMWASNSPFTFQGDVGGNATQTYTAVFDPATNTATQFIETSMLSDGRLLVNGGDSSPRTSLYDWSTNTWSTAARMNIPRGYESDTVLSTGSVLTLGGSWSGGSGGKTGEVWTNGGNWTVLSGVPETNIIGPDPAGVSRGDNHPWLFAQSNGSVFHAGPSSQMNWISTNGSGSIQSAGKRGVDPFAINGVAALYDVGLILKAGGAKSYEQHGTVPNYASNAAYMIDITRGPNQPVNVKRINGMSYQRAFASNVILPNGNVVIVGGQTVAVPFTDTTAIMVPEIWDPTTQRFNLLKPMQTPRTYHSTAILMADGRVFVGGGGLCGVGCANNHLNAEILTPPYLLNADGTPAARPAIVSAPASTTHGTTIAVSTQGAVSSFVLMRMSSITHTVNNDQRRIPLAIAASSGTAYQLAVPADSGVVPPGYYMLFALDANGVPSVSKAILIS